VGRWVDDEPGLFSLPSGRRVRGRALREGLPRGGLPEFGVYLVARDPRPFGWPAEWVRWRDFSLPSDRAAAEAVLLEVWRRCADERVEIGCNGGRGRTGTALACLAVLDGVSVAEAVQFVRAGYDRRAVETPWQRWFVGRFAKDVG
jgi:hypothetical protein